MGVTEQVVLLDSSGVAIGVADKYLVHDDSTPLHLAFSCYIFTADRQVLVTQRSLSKGTFPGVWTNSACGHPAPGESLEGAVRRRTRDELGIGLTDIRLILPDFSYVAEMNGIVENEMCPVLMAVIEAETPIATTPLEVEDHRWLPWEKLVDDVRSALFEVSPWCASQIGILAELGADPFKWPTGDSALLPATLR